MGGMVRAEGVRLLELTCLQEALGPLLGCPCCCSGQLQLHEDVRRSSGLYSALCFACQACHHRLPLHSSCRSGSQGWQVNVYTQQVKAQLGLGEDMLRDLFRIYQIPYRARNASEDCSSGDTDALLDCFLDRGDAFRSFVCSLCDQTFECVRMLKQHMGLHTVHSIECLDSVNMMGSLDRSSNQQEDALHVPIESIVTEAALNFPSPDVEKTLQLSPKEEVFTSSACNQRFEGLDLLEQNLNGDSLHSTFEYTESFEEATSNFSESLSQPVKSELAQNSSRPDISGSKYLSCNSSPNSSSAVSASQKLTCSVLEQQSVSHIEQKIPCVDVNSLHLAKTNHSSEQEEKTALENNIDAIVINTALQFQTSTIENNGMLNKHTQNNTSDSSELQLSTINTLKNSDCNNSNSNAFSSLDNGHGLNSGMVETVNISIDSSVKVETRAVEFSSLTDKLGVSPTETDKGGLDNCSITDFTCKICGQTFKRVGALKQHMVQHDSGGRYVCSECSSTFGDDIQLKKHVGEVHAKSKYSCSVCGKIFKKAFNLVQHARTHTGEKPFLCATCGKSFSDASTFNKHQKTLHSGERMLKCPTCGKCFYHAGHLRVHMRQHTGERPYLCQLCGKSYAYPDSVKKHMKIHLDERNLSCTTCGRSFRWRESLKQHLKTHQQQSTSGAWMTEEIQRSNHEDNIITSTPTERSAVSHENISSVARDMSFLESVRDTYF
ncbi:zinc finger protein 37-like [Schistocerca americana]|uniref:zinc finger protein 37-like n=1 Tax=Schistocerca americana TaxID=7009 RepID=UPI001F4F91D5|nr:zinc finger protein 37-like [Schistocerca americana]